MRIARQQALHWATGLGLVALFVSARALGPDRLPGADVCLFHRLTGVACPGCGLTRAAAAFAGGDFARSFAFHPLFPLLALEIVAIWALWGAALHGRLDLARLGPWPARVGLATGALLLAVWLARFAGGTLPA